MNTERNGNQFKANKTISISTMTFKPKGNGADNNSLKTYKVLRLGDVAYEGHTNNEFAYGRFVLNDIGDGIMSPRFSCLRPLKVQNILFWKEYIHSELVMRNILVRSTKKGTMMNELVSEDFLRNKIKVPSSREQECIGSLFRCLDSLIAAAERKVCLLKKKKHAYLNHIFTQHLRFTGHTTPWHQQAFKELVSRQSKTNGFSLLPTVEYEDIIPGEGRLNKNIYKKKKGKHGVLFQQGDILFGKLRPYLKNWVFAEFDGIAVGDFWVLRRLTGMNNRFLFFLIQSPSFEAVSSLSTGTKMPRADWNLVSNTLFSIPTEQAEQTEIARFFQTLDSLIAAAERKVSLLKKRKQAYLQKMFV